MERSVIAFKDLAIIREGFLFYRLNSQELDRERERGKIYFA
jgi:hypothetical protein